MPPSYFFSNADEVRKLSEEERTASREWADGVHEFAHKLTDFTLDGYGLFVDDELCALVVGFIRYLQDATPFWSIEIMVTKPGHTGKKYMTDLRSWLVVEGPAWERCEGRLGGIVNTEAGMAFSRKDKNVDDVQQIELRDDGDYLLVSGTLKQIIQHPSAPQNWKDWTAENRPEVLDEN